MNRAWKFIKQEGEVLDTLGNTPFKKKIIYAGLAGGLLCLISAPINILHSYVSGIVLGGVGIFLTLPFALLLHRETKSLKKKVEAEKTKMIVLDTLLEVLTKKT